MTNIWLVVIIITSVLITISILLQAQGTGLGANWSGGGETYHTKRGIEKVLFYATIGLVVLFAIASIAILIVQ